MFQLISDLRTQKRVIGALFLREIQTRWGRRNLGFAWLFAEPLVFAFPVLTMWRLMRGSHEHGFAVIALLWSGYLPLLLFRHITGSAMYCIRSNGAVLYHRVVTPLDIFIGKCGLEALGNVAAVALSFIIFYTLGFVETPANYPLLLLGVLYMTWWSLAVALIVAALSERSDIVEHVWMPISYMYLPLSGCFYMAEWLPNNMRAVALTLMPSLHIYEMIRSGLFGMRVQAFYNLGYLTSILSILTFIGFKFIRDVRDHLEFE